MAEEGGRRDILQTLDDSELVKRYRLDRAGILFVVDLVRVERSQHCFLWVDQQSETLLKAEPIYPR